MMIRVAASSLVFAAALCVTGCDDNPNTPESDSTPPATNPASEPAAGTPTAGGRNSALGKAKDAAENTKNQVEQRNADLEKMMEGDG